MTEREIYRAALSKWGPDLQMGMAMAEAGELIAALGRFVMQRRDSSEEIIDEIADMEIMLGQLRMIFSDDRVDVRKEMKLKRLEGRILMNSRPEGIE